MTARTDAVSKVRAAIRNLPSIAQWSATDKPDLDLLITPRSHAQAIDPDEMVVEGDRGVGKSFWSAILTFDDARRRAALSYPNLRLDQLRVELGFAQARGREEYPSAKILTSALKDVPANTIWRLVTLRSAARSLNERLPPEIASDKGWAGACRWLDAHAEEEERLLAEFNTALSRDGAKLLIVFDALDRIAGTDWGAIRRLVRGILEVGLELRDSYSSIRFKVFLRSDFFNDEEIWRFPDASKIKGSAARLKWTAVDLYALLFRYLDTAKVGDALSILVPKVDQSALYSDPLAQQRAFEALAGEHMGGVRRGRTYNWLPSHLSDARGEASPRSFLMALKRAAERTNDGASLPLSYLEIRDSVQDASANRVTELAEDHPWLGEVMKSLDGLIVPAERAEVFSKFKGANLEKTLTAQRNPGGSDVPRIPTEISSPTLNARDFYERLLLALKRLYVVEERPDRRVNVPDLFRVAARIKRKGGVPVPR
ncbi:hypothetical protein G3545_07790 [Starkeya sp. ORNL1]|uniref:hypothetical protein n=1 Tax=Starkeya sp. ORNL1 TaxID=2709380 RepID=UPI001463C0FA|nr:hypothetical protein [Starkeya sp. ORNL1]QJP13564.1 hypothetical protein G3545_07790 [Starkeya sp. ORNL1]